MAHVALSVDMERGTGSAMRQRGGGLSGAPSAEDPTLYSKDAKGKGRASSPCSLLRLLFVSCCFGVLTVLGWLAPALVRALKNERAPDHPTEHYYAAGTTLDSRREPFPSLFDPSSRFLSVVVPAYNEEKRLHQGLDEMIQYLRGREEADPAFTWEIVVVDDGSRDATAAIVLRDYTARLGPDRVRLLKLAANGGKGAAVRKGMLRARGQYVLMADADGATRFSDVAALLARVQALESAQSAAQGGQAAAAGARGGDGLAMAVGSRAHLSRADVASGAPGGTAVKRSPLRRFLMWGFHTLLSLAVGGTAIEDTQCGFKLFTRAAARALFPVQHIERWAFDVELVYLAGRLGIPIAEVPVAWQEIEGSKVDIASDSIQMARDILVIRLAYASGAWADTPDPAQIYVASPPLPEGEQPTAGDAAGASATAAGAVREQEAAQPASASAGGGGSGTAASHGRARHGSTGGGQRRGAAKGRAAAEVEDEAAGDAAAAELPPLPPSARTSAGNEDEVLGHARKASDASDALPAEAGL